jgi:CubicO group peptidase (beta-lactamase class C family)
VASGERYEDYVSRHLFAPAGMKSATFRGVIDKDHPRLARGYLLAPGGKVVEGPPRASGWGTRGAGGIIATVGDMYRWHLALRDGKILDTRGLAAMFHPWPDEGYGWQVEMDKSFGPVIQKGGGSPSFASHLLYYPGPDLVVLWASNDRTKRWREALNQGITAAALCTTPAIARLPVCSEPPPAVPVLEPSRETGAAGSSSEVRLPSSARIMGSPRSVYKSNTKEK